jgi:hypothetical protein
LHVEQSAGILRQDLREQRCLMALCHRGCASEDVVVDISTDLSLCGNSTSEERCVVTRIILAHRREAKLSRRHAARQCRFSTLQRPAIADLPPARDLLR